MMVFDASAGTVQGLTPGGLGNDVITSPNIAPGAVTPGDLSGAQTGAAPVYGASAWCVFNGTTVGTNAPTAGGNVSTVTRNGQGDYTVTFTSAMQDASYAAFVLVGSSSGTSLNHAMAGTSRTVFPTTGITSNTFRFTALNAAGSTVDPDVIQVAIFR